MRTWSEVKKDLLKNPNVKHEYDRLQPEFDIIRQVIGARIKKKLTQKQLAAKMGTKQSAIARLESGNANPSLAFLQKLATALGTTLKIQFG